MILIKQDKPQCLLYAFAMAMNEHPLDLVEWLGHDGLEIWWPEAGGAQRHRGFHFQEFVDLGEALGWAVVMVEAIPNLGWNGRQRVIYDEPILSARIETYLKRYNGVLTSDKHAVAWCAAEQKCYDPNGYIYGIDNFSIREFFITLKGAYGKETPARIRRTIQGIGVAGADAGNRTGVAGGPSPAG